MSLYVKEFNLYVQIIYRPIFTIRSNISIGHTKMCGQVSTLTDDDKGEYWLLDEEVLCLRIGMGSLDTV